MKVRVEEESVERVEWEEEKVDGGGGRWKARGWKVESEVRRVKRKCEKKKKNSQVMR